MAQFAPVAPIQMLEQLHQEYILGTYHLLLAHHVLEQPDRFQRLFDQHNRSTIIMDNSIVELGDSASDTKVLEACKVLQELPGTKHWIIPVLTDVMGSGEKTREAAATSYAWWRDNAPGWPLMVVAQGEDLADFMKTVDFFFADPQAFPGIEYVGIPRILTDLVGSRREAIAYVDAICPQTAVHLLGFSNNVPDDIMCANIASVEGIDSAVPLRYDYSIPDGLYTPTSSIPPRPRDWFENGRVKERTVENLYNIRKWVA